MICTEWSITNTSVRLLNHHIKITFWVLSVCPFQMSPTSWLRIFYVLSKGSNFSICWIAEATGVFSPNPLTGVLIENLLWADYCYYFPYKTDGEPKGQVLRRQQYPSQVGEICLQRDNSAARCPETRTQEIRLSDDWIFTGSPGMKAVKTRLWTASFCSPVTPSDGENRVLGFTRRAQQDLRGLA